MYGACKGEYEGMHADFGPIGLDIDAAELIGSILGIDGWSQARIASELGISQPTVSRWLAGKQEPSYRHYFALLKILALYQQSSAPAFVYLSGFLDEGLQIAPFDDNKVYVIKLRHFSVAEASFALLIKTDLSPFGPIGWVVLLKAVDEKSIEEGDFCSYRFAEEITIIRQRKPGTKLNRFDLVAPHCPPIKNTTALPMMAVVACVPPAGIEGVRSAEFDALFQNA